MQTFIIKTKCFFFGHLKEIWGIKSQVGKCVRCGKQVFQNLVDKN